MVPFGLSRTEFLVRYRGCLDAASPHLIDTFRTLLARHVPRSVKEAEIEVFFDLDGPFPPVAWIYFAGDYYRLDPTNQSIFPGRSMKLSIGLEKMERFDDRYATDQAFGGLAAMADATKAWIAECWWKAGGWSYRIPVVLGVHDGFGDGTYVKLSER